MTYTEQIWDGNAWVDISPTIGSWTTYNPSWTNVTVGSGTVDFKYVQIGKFVTVKGILTFGADTSFSGDPKFSLPVTSVAVNTRFPVGTAAFYDSNTEVYYGPTLLLNTTTAGTRRFTVSNNNVVTQNVSSTTPMTWAVGDQFMVQFVYEAA